MAQTKNKSSAGIPKISGIGPGLAMKYWREHGTLDSET